MTQKGGQRNAGPRKASLGLPRCPVSKVHLPGAPQSLPANVLRGKCGEPCLNGKNLSTQTSKPLSHETIKPWATLAHPGKRVSFLLGGPQNVGPGKSHAQKGVSRNRGPPKMDGSFRFLSTPQNTTHPYIIKPGESGSLFCGYPDATQAEIEASWSLAWLMLEAVDSKNSGLTGSNSGYTRTHTCYFEGDFLKS